MERLAAQHPNTVMAVATASTMIVGLATRDFWCILVVSTGFLPVLRRSARRHAS
jgi:hypothetical protein